MFPPGQTGKLQSGRFHQALRQNRGTHTIFAEP